MSDTAITIQQFTADMLFQGFWTVFAALFLFGLFTKTLTKHIL